MRAVAILVAAAWLAASLHMVPAGHAHAGPAPDGHAAATLLHDDDHADPATPGPTDRHMEVDHDHPPAVIQHVDPAVRPLPAGHEPVAAAALSPVPPRTPGRPPTG